MMKWTDKLLTETLIPVIPTSVRPNHITLFRVCMAPVVGWLLYRENFFWGGVIFAILVITDGIDGALARSRNIVSDWGKLFDPIADKLLITLAVAVLVTRYMSVWLAGAIILLEIVILILAALCSFGLHQSVQANRWGKLKMLLQSTGIICIILAIATHTPELITAAGYIFYTALAVALLSILRYHTRPFSGIKSP